MKDYVEASLELHMFYVRIMKEHAFFLEAGFMKANEQCIQDARWFKEKFDELLCNVIQCSDGVIDRDVIDSGEAITGFTLCSEEKTSKLTGLSINTEVTKLEEEFASRCNRKTKSMDCNCDDKVEQLNQHALCLLEKFIEFQTWVLNQIICCEMATHNFPAQIEHIIKEAVKYQTTLLSIQCNHGLEKEDRHSMVMFWLEGMKDHAATIRGLLDPGYEDLISEADTFTAILNQLVEAVRTLESSMDCSLMSEIMNQIMELRDYKSGITKGINDCLVSSLILPLLADHLLREINHFLRMLMTP